MKCILIAIVASLVIGGGIFAYNAFLSEESDGVDVSLPGQTGTEDNTAQAVPAPEFEDVPEMIVSEEIADTEPEAPLIPPSETAGGVVWKNTKNGWEPSATPPVCPSPLRLKTPVDLSVVTSILYPGQYRGGNYKPHGGFRFDESQDGKITIIAPMDALIVDGGRLLVDGEVQYIFDFISPCGIWYRFGHIVGPSPKLAAIAETFPPPVEGNSHTYEVSPYVEVTAGEIIAAGSGIQGLDWGVYDLRSKNSASEDPLWAAEHPGQQAQNGICWFNLLSPEDEALVRSLPPTDGVSGSMSDYCL